MEVGIYFFKRLDFFFNGVSRDWVTTTDDALKDLYCVKSLISA